MQVLNRKGFKFHLQVKDHMEVYERFMGFASKSYKRGMMFNLHHPVVFN